MRDSAFLLQVAVWSRQRRIVGLLSVLLLSFGPGCSDESPSDLVWQAEHAVRSGDYRAAAVYYGKAATAAPEDGLVHWQLAKVLLIVRDGPTAEKEIRTASRLGIDDQRTRPALAEALFLQGRHQEVIALTVDGLEKNPAATILAYQSRAHLELGQVDSAEGLYKKAVRMVPYSADVFFVEAELALTQGDLKMALEALHNVYLLEPEFTYTAGRQGELAMVRGDVANAERYFSEAVERRFGPWRERLSLGFIRLQQGKVEQALVDAELLLASSAEHSDVQFFASQVYLLKGEPERARKALAQALQRDPDNVPALYSLARLEFEQAKVERSESLARSALALKPTFIPVRKLLAVLLLEQGRADEAVELIMLTPAVGPTDSELIRILAYGYLKAGRFDYLIGLAGRLRGKLDSEEEQAFAQAIKQIEAGETDAASEVIQRSVAIRVQDLRAVDPLEFYAAMRRGRSGNGALVATGTDLEQETGQQSGQGAPDLPQADTQPPDGLAADASAVKLQGAVRRPAGQPTQRLEAPEQEPKPGDIQQAGLSGDPGGTSSGVTGMQSLPVVDTGPPVQEQVAENTTETGTGILVPVEDAQLPADAAAEGPAVVRTLTETVSSEGSLLVESIEPSVTEVVDVVEVEQFVQEWADAWSRQDVDDYLGRYAADFRPADGASLVVWADQRRDRLTRPESIRVQVASLKVVPLDRKHVVVTFEQSYQAKHYRDLVSKAMEMRLETGGWKILSEQSR